MPEYHFKIPEELKRLGGKAKELLVNCDEAKEYKNKFESDLHQIKILPEDVKRFGIKTEKSFAPPGLGA